VALPQLCKDPDRGPLGACRTCLVHVEGQRGTPAACHLPARDGMVVDTQHPEVVRVRSMVLDLTLSMLTPPGEYEGGVAPLTRTARNGFGQLGDATARHGRLEPSWAPLHAYDEDASKSFFVLDRDACILCGRCAVACDRITRPMIKRDGRWHEASWDEALDAAADGLAKHRGRFGALASAKATNEDGYLVQKFCRVVMATNDVDHCTRLCHSPSVEAM